jgi:hypothetical protein
VCERLKCIVSFLVERCTYHEQMSARASVAASFSLDDLAQSALNATASQRRAQQAELVQGDSEELPQLRRLLRTVHAEVLDDPATAGAAEHAEAAKHAGASSQDTYEEDLERPDWSVHFAETPLNVMEEAARKMMSRGAHGTPAWTAWREDLRSEGKELAATWGKRDKNTRHVQDATSAPAADVPAPTPAALHAHTTTRGPKSAASLWNQDA